MAEKLAPQWLVAQLTEILSERETLEGIFAAAECCLDHLAADRPLDRKRAMLLAALLLETAAELVVDSERTVAAVLPTLLDRKRGRLGGVALAHSAQRERQRFQAASRNPNDRPRPTEPARLEPSDRALVRAIQRSIQELTASRYSLAMEWLRLKNDFFPQCDPLDRAARATRSLA